MMECLQKREYKETSHSVRRTVQAGSFTNAQLWPDFRIMHGSFSESKSITRFIKALCFRRGLFKKFTGNVFYDKASWDSDIFFL